MKKIVKLAFMGSLLLLSVANAVTIKARSIGTSTAAVFTAVSGATSNSTKDTITLTDAAFPANIGEGDSVVIGGASGFILARVSATVIALQSPLSSSASSAAISIYRCYANPVLWENAAPVNLVTSDIIWKGVCYNDGIFEIERLRFQGSTVDSAHYKWLTVAEGQRHGGIMGRGARMSNSYGQSWAALWFVEDFAKVEWLEVFGVSAGKTAAYGISEAAATAPGKVYINNLLIHDVFLGVNLNSTSTREFQFFNCIITKTGKEGIIGRTATATVRCYNVTVVHGATDVDVSNSGFRRCFVKNCIAMFYGSKGSGHYDFLECDPASDYNISNDASAPGSNSKKSTASAGLFADLSNLNFHLAEGSAAVGAGDSTGCPATAALDIDGETRTGKWDIGADMYSTVAVENNRTIKGANASALNVSSVNPFSNSVVLTCNLGSEKALLSIHSVDGRTVYLKSVTGNSVIEWNAKNVSNGVYFAKLNAASRSEVKALVLKR